MHSWSHSHHPIENEQSKHTTKNPPNNKGRRERFARELYDVSGVERKERHELTSK